MRIAMWSGPRNLSTVMMYAFANRPDFAVWDEPFYAPYLAKTDADHPMRDQILQVHEADPGVVAQQCLDPIPDQKSHFYMKHMPHHMVDGMPVAWAKDCVNVHLIRHPARVIASYGAKRGNITSDDIGFRQQLAMFEQLGGLVIDSADIRRNPKEMLQKLCASLHLPFNPAMLSWKAGPKSFDGVWADHWYNAVHKSTGFAGAEGPLPELKDRDAALLKEALPYYENLASFAL